jgi:amidase
VLLPPTATGGSSTTPGRLLAPAQPIALLDSEARPVFAAAAAQLARRLGLAPVTADLPADHWLETYLVLQNSEAAALHRAWLTRHGDAFGSLIGRRFARALAVTAADVARAEQQAATVVARASALLGDDAWLLWPSAAGAAPRRGLSDDAVDAATGPSLTLGALASLAGLPQISIPAGEVAGCPFGVSLIGPRGSDRALLAAAVAIAEDSHPPRPSKEDPS